MDSVQEHSTDGPVYRGDAVLRDAKNPVRITWSFGLTVIYVSKDQI